jgi:ATP-binding cassette, subfamily F, member 3
MDLQLLAGEHLAIVGLNGAGKSTLLKTLSGRLKPLSGSIEEGPGATFAFFAQHVAEELNPDHTVLRALQHKAHRDVLPQEILDLAGSLLFSGDDVQKPIRVLSGGEKSRVALGQVLLQKASCLLLDEPTNHLDFDTVEALTQALQSFEGAVVVVSHDRAFIRRVGGKILEVGTGRASAYPGTYDDYVWSLERGAYSTLASQGRGGAGPGQPVPELENPLQPDIRRSARTSTEGCASSKSGSRSSKPSSQKTRPGSEPSTRNS